MIDFELNPTANPVPPFFLVMVEESPGQFRSAGSEPTLDKAKASRRALLNEGRKAHIMVAQPYDPDPLLVGRKAPENPICQPL